MATQTSLSLLLDGNLWGIHWEYGGIPFADHETPPLVKEVCDILDMWSFLESSYASLSQDEKVMLEAEAAPFGSHVHFNGFDGNNECEYMGVARFLIEKLGRFEEFKGRDMNSHAPSIGVYRRMYAVFEPMRISLVNGRLSVSQIISI